MFDGFGGYNGRCVELVKIAIIVRVNDNSSEKDVVQDKTESRGKEGHQETVETPLTSPSDDLKVKLDKNKNIK